MVQYFRGRDNLQKYLQIKYEFLGFVTLSGASILQII